jgi:hypothetical protein
MKLNSDRIQIEISKRIDSNQFDSNQKMKQKKTPKRKFKSNSQQLKNIKAKTSSDTNKASRCDYHVYVLISNVTAMKQAKQNHQNHQNRQHSKKQFEPMLNKQLTT